MIYILEGRVFFRSDDGALWLEGQEDEKVVLTPIVSRLLDLFFREQGKILTREEIMHRVWEIHGLEPSNNSLNQYVSQIRKVMHHYGMPDDLIHTIPRVGFTFSSDVTVNTQESRAIRTDSSAEEPLPAVPAGPARQSRKGITGIFLVLFIVLPFVMYGMTKTFHQEELATPPVLIGEVGGCPVYSVLMGRAVLMPETLNLAKKYITDNGLSCRDGRVIYFFTPKSVLGGQGGRIYLSHCQKKDSELVYCSDNSYHTWS